MENFKIKDLIISIDPLSMNKKANGEMMLADFCDGPTEQCPSPTGQPCEGPTEACPEGSKCENNTQISTCHPSPSLEVEPPEDQQLHSLATLDELKNEIAALQRKMKAEITMQ